MQEVLPGEAPQPTGGQEEDALPRLRLTGPQSLPVSLLICAAGGLAVSLAFPPAGLWWVAFVAPAGLLWVLRDARPRRGLVLGFVFGLAFYGATLYWILRFGLMAWTALAIVSALTVALFGLLAPIVRRPGRPIVTAVGLAALWTAIDWVRGVFPLGGFTWGSLGVSQVSNRLTLRLATVAGVWGVTFAVVLVNALLVEAVAGVGTAPRRIGRLCIAALVAFAPIVIPFSVANGSPIRIATLQVDVRAAVSGTSVGVDRAVAKLNENLHLRLSASPPDLAVWGEGALDPGAANDPRVLADVERTIAAVGVPTLVGAVTDDPDGRQRTAVLLFDGDGVLVGRYDK